MNKIVEEIKKAKHILLHCHPSPDPDSVGSSLAMKLALEQLGKKVTLLQGDDKIPESFDFPAVETITKKSYGEIDINEFDLFIILDSGSIDRVTSKQKVEFPDSLMTIVIDHHISNKGFAKINLVDADYPATAQILFDLFKEMNIKLNHDIALNLFTGIYTDTGGFRYREVLPSTIKIAAELAELAPDFTKVLFTMENSNRKEKLIFEGLSLSSLMEFYDGKLAITFVTYDQVINNNLEEDDCSGSEIANKLKSVVGFEIGVNLIEQKQNLVKISFRTRDAKRYDVSKIAASLGGGGHISAAGARLNMTIPEAIDKVVKTAKELYNL